MTSASDRFSIEIIQNSVQAAADEMFSAMQRTAMSAIIYEVLDMGTGITDGKGNLVGSGAGIPTFVGMLDKAVTKVIQAFPGPDAVCDGDIFMVNDPYSGGVTHLNDVILCMPVFSGNQVVAWTSNAAHWNDIGGMAPGSMTTAATEIFQEGIQIPPIKLFSAGKLQQSVLDILKANCRMPDFMEGDLWAGVASLRVGEKRLSQMVDRYGADLFIEALEEYLSYGEQVTLAALKQLPNGQFEFTERQDNGLDYKVSIQISDDKFVVDLRDNPKQYEGPYNLSRDGVVIAAQMILKSVTSPHTVCNSGSFRPLEVLTSPGTVFDPLHPAPMAFYYETRIRAHDLIWQALAEVAPDRLPSGHFSSICGTMIGGVHPETGRHYSIIEPEAGGWGGSLEKDGNSAMFSACHGETYNCPAEINEMRNGILVEKFALNNDDGGEGQYRGGKGICMEYRICSDNAWLTAAYTRAETHPWGINGGSKGSLNYIEVLQQDLPAERYASVSGLILQKGDVVRIVTANGAGWGNPRNRDPEEIRGDIENDYLTVEQARLFYGYVDLVKQRCSLL